MTTIYSVITPCPGGEIHDWEAQKDQKTLKFKVGCKNCESYLMTGLLEGTAWSVATSVNEKNKAA